MGKKGEEGLGVLSEEEIEALEKAEEEALEKDTEEEEETSEDNEVDDTEGTDTSDTDKKDDEADGQTSDEADNEDDEADELEAEADTDYKPNYSYNIDGQPYEFDDRFKEIIKDKESEDAVRDLFTRAKGLEKAQKIRDSYKERLHVQERDYGQLKEYTDKTLMKSKALYDNGNKLEAILNLFPADDLLHCADEIKRYNEASDVEKEAWQIRFEHNMRLHDAQQEGSVADRQTQELLARNTELEINQAINFDKETKEIAEWVDSRHGEGFFKKEVYKHAEFGYNDARRQRQRPPTPTEFTGQVKERYKRDYEYFLSLQPKTAGRTVPDKLNTKKTISRKERIPSVKSKGSVVGGKKFADLKPEEQTLERAMQMIKEEAEL